MRSRYSYNQIVRGQSITNPNKFYPAVGTTRYPQIPLRSDDIYIISTYGDRFDKLANQYYSDASYWWVISIANEQLPQNSLFPPVGQQIRIPGNLSLVLSLMGNVNS